MYRNFWGIDKPNHQHVFGAKQMCCVVKRFNFSLRDQEVRFPFSVNRIQMIKNNENWIFLFPGWVEICKISQTLSNADAIIACATVVKLLNSDNTRF